MNNAASNLPRWLLAAIIAAVVIVAIAAVATAVVVISDSNARAEQQAKEQAEIEAVAAAEAARLQLIPDAAESCGVSTSLVTDGGRYFAESTGFGGEITIDDLECILSALGGPPDIVDGSAIRLQAGDPPGKAGWGDFTLTEEYPYFMADISHVIELSD